MDKNILDMTEDELQEHLEVETAKIMENCSDPRKLKAIQWKIDVIKQKYAGKQMKIVLELNRLMLESFSDLNDMLQEISGGSDEQR